MGAGGTAQAGGQGCHVDRDRLVAAEKGEVAHADDVGKDGAEGALGALRRPPLDIEAAGIQPAAHLAEELDREQQAGMRGVGIERVGLDHVVAALVREQRMAPVADMPLDPGIGQEAG